MRRGYDLSTCLMCWILVQPDICTFCIHATLIFRDSTFIYGDFSSVGMDYPTPNSLLLVPALGTTPIQFPSPCDLPYACIAGGWNTSCSHEFFTSCHLWAPPECNPCLLSGQCKEHLSSMSKKLPRAFGAYNSYTLGMWTDS